MRSKPIHHLSLDSANFSSVFEDTTATSDNGTDFDTLSLVESTSGKITSLCEKADVLMRELVEMVGPLTPPLTPAASVVRQTSEYKENHCVQHASCHGAASEEISDLQFRISRLELQVSQIASEKAKQATISDEVAELKRWVEIAQAELLSAREEARDTKIQVDILTKRTSMLEVRSGSFPGLGHALDSSELSTVLAESGVYRLSSVSSDEGSQVLHSMPFASERAPVQLPRARSFDSGKRQGFYPIPGARNLRSPQVSQQSGSKDVLVPRRRGSPSPPPRVVEPRMCRVEQLGKGTQQIPVRLLKTAEPAVCARNGKTAKPGGRTQICSRSARNTNFA
jgi:hypothetical protein